MRDHIGEEFDGVISGVTKWGAYVELENTVEGLAHVADMWDDHYEFYEQSYELVGEHTGKTYKPGQKVRICVTDADKLQKDSEFQDSVRKEIFAYVKHSYKRGVRVCESIWT